VLDRDPNPRPTGIAAGEVRRHGLAARLRSLELRHQAAPADDSDAYRSSRSNNPGCHARLHHNIWQRITFISHPLVVFEVSNRLARPRITLGAKPASLFRERGEEEQARPAAHHANRSLNLAACFSGCARVESDPKS
jgi:hypothetical protein